MYWIELAYLAITVGMAYWHRHLIRQNRPIVHWIWAGAYIAACLPLFFINPWLMVGCILIREVVFSPFLNIIRGLWFWYQGRVALTDKISLLWTKVFYFVSVFILIAIQFIIK